MELDPAWSIVAPVNGKLTLLGGTAAYFYWDLEKSLNCTYVLVHNPILLFPNQLFT